MKKILTTIICMLLVKASISQCNVNTMTLEDLKIYRANYEEIYRNKDLHNGLRSVRVSCYYIKRADEFALMIDVLYAKSSVQPALVPRKIQLVFSNGTTQDLSAYKNDSPDLGLPGVIAEKCSFNIPSELAKKIAITPITSIRVVDTRTNEEISATPYNMLIKEQIDCISKASE